MERYRILVIENMQKYRKSLAKLLITNGYEVVTAKTVSEGKDILRKYWVHLATVDVRAGKPDVDEPDDESGLDFVMDKSHPSYGVIPRLILTAYPDWEKVRRALAPDESGITPAEDFFVKGVDAPEEILRKIDETIKRWWNPDLEIDWEATTPICLASFLEPEERWGVEESAPESQGEEADRECPLQLSAQELTALLRRTYSEEPQIRWISIRQVRRGHANTFIAFVQVHPHNSGPGREDVLKCGDRQIIEREVQNFENNVRPYTNQIVIRTVSKTTHYAAISYIPAGGGLETCETFRDFYQANEVASIRAILRDLFQGEGSLLSQWYLNYLEQKESLEGQDIFSHYNKILKIKYREEKNQVDGRGPIRSFLEQLTRTEIHGFRVSIDKGVLTAYIPGHSPLVVEDFMSLVLGKKTLNLPGPHWWGITHGDLNGENILVDERGRPWLIDFERTGWGPAFRDFAELEGVIRWELVRTNNMMHIPVFETVLMKAGLGRLEQTEPLLNANSDGWSQDLKKAASVILFLRHIMNDIYGKVAENIYKEYLVGLFYYALRFVSQNSVTSYSARQLARTRKIHALLSILLIVDFFQSN